MDINIEQMRKFLHLLTGSSDIPVTWQVLHDPKNEVAPDGLNREFTATLDESLPFIRWSQQQNCGIYVTMNITDGTGRKIHNMVGYRCVFADFDNMAEPEWALDPHFIQKRDDTHGHAIWLVKDIGDADTFKALQKRIAIYHDTDHQVTDPSRVLRIAGSVHYKNPAVPAMYHITEDNTDGDHKHTVAEIEEAFPLTAQQDAELNDWLTKRKGIQEGSGYEYNEVYINKFTNWLITTAPPALIGEGSHTVFKVAGYGHDHGVPLEVAQEIMWEHYNPRCVPAWQLNEKDNFYDIVERGYYYANSAAGCKTITAKFQSRPPLVTPTGGWDADAERGRASAPVFTTVEAITESVVTDDDPFKGRINSTQAALLTPEVDNKAPHSVIANMLDGMLFNGNEIIRNQGIFYIYKNNYWQQIADDVIKARIYRAIAELKPNDSLTRGVFNVFCDVVNVERIEIGKYIDGNKRCTKNLVVFNNGIVDLGSDSPVIEPHDRNFFTFNKRDYNWNPEAKCPNFHAFIESLQWEDDMKEQLMQLLAYLITNDISLQKFAMFVGKSRGGKGVLTDVIRTLVGDSNVAAPSLSNLHKDHVLESLATKSLALIPDAHSVAYNSRDSVLSMLKAITGCDPVTYNKKYKPPQTLVLGTRFIISTNNVPDFNDASGALANRMLIFPFTQSFVGRENVNLRQELLAEIEGIAQEAAYALVRLRKVGKFTEGKAGLLEKQDIKEDMFVLSKYVSEACTCEYSGFTATHTLYHAYRLWSGSSGIKSPLTEIQFSKVLRSSDLDIHHDRIRVDGQQMRGFKGMGLNADYAEKIRISSQSNVVDINDRKIS